MVGVFCVIASDQRERGNPEPSVREAYDSKTKGRISLSILTHALAIARSWIATSLGAFATLRP